MGLAFRLGQARHAWTGASETIRPVALTRLPAVQWREGKCIPFWASGGRGEARRAWAGLFPF